MVRLRLRVVLTLAALILTTACAAEPPREAPGATESATDSSVEVNAILDRYFQAVEGKDLVAFRALLADPGVFTAVTPTGRLQSPDDLQKFFQDLENAYAELRLTRSNVAIGTEGSAAWAAFDWMLDGRFADGSPAAFTGWETQIYRKTADGWRIAHLHYSVPFVVPAAR
jgi:ketosteroid isomerase-like protein